MLNIDTVMIQVFTSHLRKKKTREPIVCVNIYSLNTSEKKYLKKLKFECIAHECLRYSKKGIRALMASTN